jgi:cell division protein FtsB
MSAISYQVTKANSKPAVKHVRDSVSNFGFGLFISAILLLGLLGGLVINTSLSHSQFTISQLRAELTLAADLQESLAQEVARLESPELLKERAILLGMVPGPGAGFVDLRDGRIIAPGLDDKYREADYSRVVGQ